LNLSLNETRAMARKATRGAGYGWGLADEAGRAVEGLCAMGLDGCEALADLLADAGAHRSAPVIDGTVWRAEDGPLCPLQTGLALLDRCAALDLAATPIALQRVACPLLIVPFVADMSRLLKVAVRIDAGGGHITILGPGAATLSDFPQVPSDLCIALSTRAASPRKLASRAHPDPAAWAVLNALAHRTYAPATEASRQAGAGAGLTDND